MVALNIKTKVESVIIRYSKGVPVTVINILPIVKSITANGKGYGSAGLVDKIGRKAKAFREFVVELIVIDEHLIMLF